MTASTQPPAAGDPPDPVGLLIFRGWLERGANPALRVRVTRLDDLGQPPTSFVTASVDELVDTLQDWLRRVEVR